MLKFIKTPIFIQNSRHWKSGFDTIIKSEWTYIRLTNHFSVFLCWCHVSVAANGFQKFAISLLKTKFLQNFTPLPLFEKVIPAIQETSTSRHIIHTIIFYFTDGVGRGCRSIFASFCSTIRLYNRVNCTKYETCEILHHCRRQEAR